MANSVVQTFDRRQQLNVAPAEIQPGDWLRDLGRLRQVKSVEALDDEISPETLHLIHFTDDQGSRSGSLGVRSVTRITVWREL
jgi:hypothetical protein